MPASKERLRDLALKRPLTRCECTRLRREDSFGEILGSSKDQKIKKKEKGNDHAAIVVEVMSTSLCALIILLLVSSRTRTLLWSKFERGGMYFFHRRPKEGSQHLVDHDSYATWIVVPIMLKRLRVFRG